MSNLSIDLRYRPLHFGLCIRKGNREDFRKAVRLANVMWGGRFNPIIPVENIQKASRLAKIFRVDGLYPVYDNPLSPQDENFESLSDNLKYLVWPISHGNDLYRPMPQGKRLQVLTIRRAISRLASKLQDNPPEYGPALYHPKLDEDDPLYDVLLAMIGDYPQPKDGKENFHEEISERIGFAAGRVHLTPQHDLTKVLASDKLTPRSLTVVGLNWHLRATHYPGIYVGKKDNVGDLVAYWNLQALGNDIIFYDPDYSDRLGKLANSQLEHVSDSYTEDWTNTNEKNSFGYPSIWSSQSSEELSVLVEEIDTQEQFRFEPYSGERLQHSPFSSPVSFCEGTEKSVLASVSEQEHEVQVSFQLPDRPVQSQSSEKHFVVSFRPRSSRSLPNDRTLRAPNIPELGGYVGRFLRPGPSWSVVERDRLGVICSGSDSHLTLRPLRKQDLTSQLFGLADIHTKPSKEGRIASRLIEQMGGLQSCRVFKLEGVRNLIRKYGPKVAFTRGQAALEIGQFEEGERPQLDRYSKVYIEPGRSADDLGPRRIFDHLIRKNVFQAGLEIECPNCRLEFWNSLDNIQSTLRCEYCRYTFDPTSSLDNLTWRYRRSGLFGRADNQGGGIPVALTLMQLDTVINTNLSFHVTGTEIELPSGTQCESDFIFLTQADTQTKPDVPQVVLSECKSHYPISESDVANLKAVAERLESELRLQVYFSFSKLGDFSDEELDLFRDLREEFPSRVITLSKRELEPQNVFWRVRDKAGPAVSLETLASSSSSLYLDQ